MSPLISLLPPLWSGDGTKHDVTCKERRLSPWRVERPAWPKAAMIDKARALRALSLAEKARALQCQHECWLAVAKAGRLLVSLRAGKDQIIVEPCTLRKRRKRLPIGGYTYARLSPFRPDAVTLLPSPFISPPNATCLKLCLRSPDPTPAQLPESYSSSSVKDPPFASRLLLMHRASMMPSWRSHHSTQLDRVTTRLSFYLLRAKYIRTPEPTSARLLRMPLARVSPPFGPATYFGSLATSG
jgi:hypothetical protein